MAQLLRVSLMFSNMLFHWLLMSFFSFRRSIFCGMKNY